MTEILRPEQYEEYEAFCQNHPRGGFTQSTRWFQVKNNWKGEVVVVRDAAGKIRAGCAVLVQKLPVIGAALLYAPRGPVCDLENRPLLKELGKVVFLELKCWMRTWIMVDGPVQELFTKPTAA